ncbi:NAD(P)-dependent oxidoreductase [Rhizobium leguminosarum]|uniref:NAD(P)-dependent oxidoreductase n=1 Tax=Rhizobium leguminosarum TaxID=384 RepID=UPI001C954751|nr:NAD(P)-dependent oxidoreductase [Rhizobium leguminosarum]MBY5406819.1 glycerate dehydrogenase [Rhizobium leguminosarum]
MRAVFVDCTEELSYVIKSRNLPVPDAIRINEGNPTEADLIALCANAEVVLVEHTVVTPNVLDACPSIRAVIFMGTGAGTYINRDEAARRGVDVYTTPGYGDRSVAEHALALAFAAARRIAEMDRQIRSGIWSPVGGLQLKGQKIAVLGMGGIGTSMADMAAAIGMRVAAWNRTKRDHAAFVADIDEALQDANFVSLHLTLNSQTEGILDRRRLALPATGFILINTARAGLIEEATLLEMLADGRIGHAALDVFPEEPLRQGNPYVSLNNVTLTAHAAYMTAAAYEELWLRTLKAYTSL